MNVGLAVALLVVAVCAPHTASGLCGIGYPEPSVITLYRARLRDGLLNAAVVTPECSVIKIQLVGLTQSIRSLNIDRIEGIAADTSLFTSDNNPLSLGADLSAALNMDSASFSNIDDAAISKMVFPPQIIRLEITSSGFSSMSGATFPDRLARLKLANNRLKTISDFKIPPNLDLLNLSGNPITSISGIALPTKLENFACAGCRLTSVREVTWPSTLKTVDLETNAISDFVIRDTELLTFKRLNTFKHNIIQSSCKSKFAKLEVVGGAKLCVLPAGAPSDDSSTGDNGDSHSSSTKGSSSGSSDITSSSSVTSSSSSSLRSDAASGNNNARGSDSSASGASNVKKKNDKTNKAGSTSSDSTSTASGISTAVLSAIIIVSIIFVVLVGVTSYRVIIARRQRRDKDIDMVTFAMGKYQTGQTPVAIMGESDNIPSSTQEYMTNDVRNDKLLIPFRIDQRDITLSKQIARGGFGAIYRGTYQGRDVAIKQMLPNTWRDDQMLSDFMDEIRMCAKLEHPKIVSFIGLAWSSRRDLSVVIEYMAGGDLYSAIVSHRDATWSAAGSGTVSGRSWLQRWTPQQLQCKASIARDVAEAIVYLHSFNSPILHRDLKARNVLLDVEGHAKLSDFGISREMSVDETMTSEIGTAAWIAPEVLRGERYTEHADIYSFGVLLVEMDRGSHPYADQLILDVAVPGGEATAECMATGIEQKNAVAQNNTQIAVLVSNGMLRPQVSAGCPSSIDSLAKLCLKFDPSERPTAMEISHSLRQMCRSL